MPDRGAFGAAVYGAGEGFFLRLRVELAKVFFCVELAKVFFRTPYGGPQVVGAPTFVASEVKAA